MNSNLFFDIVLACSKNRGIGLNGGLPWDLPRDFKFFRNITSTPLNSTKQNVIIYGRKSL